MGNRAVLQFGPDENTSVGIYLHWNGGRESVQAFLDYADEAGVRDQAGDPEYFLARLTQIIANFFGGTTSIGLGIAAHLDRDNGDNGTYIIENGKIASRLFHEDEPFDAEYHAGVLEATRTANAPLFAGKVV